MPARHPPYPFVEVSPTAATPLEIEILADRKAHDWGYRDGKSLDEVCKNAGVDIEYSAHPNEILLETPLEGRSVIWLPDKGRKRDDRVVVATALGHWVLHIDETRKSHPGSGVQALHKPGVGKPGAGDAKKQAIVFGLAFLMPKSEFVEAWAKGRSQAAADRFDVPTTMTYLRAETLELSEEF